MEQLAIACIWSRAAENSWRNKGAAYDLIHQSQAYNVNTHPAPLFWHVWGPQTKSFYFLLQSALQFYGQSLVFDRFALNRIDMLFHESSNFPANLFHLGRYAEID